MKKNGIGISGFFMVLVALIIPFLIWLGVIAAAAWVIFSVFNAVFN